MEPSIISRPVPTEHIVIVCRKCTRKLKGGFGKKQKHGLRSMLRDAAKAGGLRRTLRIVETGCLSLCPKRAVTLTTSMRPGALVAVPEGASAEAVLDHLGLRGG